MWTINFRAQGLINADRKTLLLRSERQENFDRQSTVQYYLETLLVCNES